MTTPSAVDPAHYATLRWRGIGPFRGGRVVAVAGDFHNPLVHYFGSTGGGVWKTTDGGRIWVNVSDPFFRTASVGALAVAPADSNVVYAGMGECSIRGNVSIGDGLYRSTNAGRTWQHRGLKETRHIARVRVHPEDPDLIYVAALGHAFGPNEERGVFRSADGGGSWEHILFQSEDAGAIDLAMDPTNPRILYAAFWEARRQPWRLTSGGPNSGLFMSTDGGDHWTDISTNRGLPRGIKGRIGVTLSPANPDRLWALIEAEEGGIFRSDDQGRSWNRVHPGRPNLVRPWYYSHIHADPQDADTIYLPNVLFWKSTDGGRSLTQIPTPHCDVHDLWIDPLNSRRMIQGNDGGACVSLTGGESWSSLFNQPTGEMYRVTTDTRFPYRVYGAQQDHRTVSIPSRSDEIAISERTWYPVGGSEAGDVAVRPDNPDIAFAGNHGGLLTRYDHRSGQIRNITVWPEDFHGWGAKDHKYRFAWTFPIALSPHDPGILYATGNHVFRSADEGENWEVISPDLTRNDVTKLGSSGGPITLDNSGAEIYCTVYAFAESPVRQGLLWAGSDDGLVHVSLNDGASWDNVTSPDLPEWTTIHALDPSPHDPAAVYLAGTRYKLDDYRPFLMKSQDFGKSWTVITQGIPSEEFTRVIREDPHRRGLLFAGTECGVHISFDDGCSWQALRQNLPVVPVHDLRVVDGDLVAATHGRGFWILDDLTVLRQLAARGPLKCGSYLYRPRDTYRMVNRSSQNFIAGGRVVDTVEDAKPTQSRATPGAWEITYQQRRTAEGQVLYTFFDAGENPPNGVTVHYILPPVCESEVRIEFFDAAGRPVRSFADGPAYPEDDPVLGVPVRAGANRFLWDMRYRSLVNVPGGPGPRPNIPGPLAPPGEYRVRLTVDRSVDEQTFQVVKDPRVDTTDEAFALQFELLCRIHEELAAAYDAVDHMRLVQQEMDHWLIRAEGHPAAGDLGIRVRDVKARLRKVEDQLVEARSETPDFLVSAAPKLCFKLVQLFHVVASADAAPTSQSREVFDSLTDRVHNQLEQYRNVLASDGHEVARAVQALELPPLSIL